MEPHFHLHVYYNYCRSKLANCRSQFLLDRLGRCIKLFVSTESTSCHRFASQFGPEFFYNIMWKTPKTIANTASHTRLFIWMKHRSAPSNSDNLDDDGGGWACACVRVHACVRVRACVRDVFAIYNHIIWPGLMMIIIKTIILYFMQITHTDDFPSTGTRLVINKSSMHYSPAKYSVQTLYSSVSGIAFLSQHQTISIRPYLNWNQLLSQLTHAWM